MAKPQKTYLGCVFAAAMIGLAFAILYPVFASAKVAARQSTSREAGKAVAQAAALFAERHGGRLPGKDWRERLEEIDPVLRGRLRRRVDDWTVGYAAVPGTLGKRLEDLSPETVLYVEYRSIGPIDILQDTSDIGDPDRPGSALAVTVEGTNGGAVRFQPSATIGLMLGRQGATGLR